MRKTKKAYEEYLNDIYSGYEAVQVGAYMIQWNAKVKRYCGAIELLRWGKYGTALRRYDSIAFEVGFGEWVIEGDV